MERSDWGDDDAPRFRPPLPPEDRLWRHPSEMAAGVLPASAMSPTSSPMRSRLVSALVVSAASAVLVAGLVGFLVTRTNSPPSTAAPTTAAAASDAIPLSFSAAGGGLVHVLATTDSGTRTSTAVSVDDERMIVTTAAAVAGATALTAVLPDGSRTAGHVLSVDKETGAAVIGIDHPTPPQPVGRAGVLHEGDVVHVPGVATAQVEALGVKATGRDGSNLQHLMRLDVGRLRVEEGMPVLDEQARVVAITIHDDDGKVFGIPVEILRAAVRTTGIHGHVVVPWLGVTGVDATDFDQAGFDGGAAIQKVVTGSPAALAGLQPGDVVIAVDDQALDTMSALALALRDHDAGDAIALTYLRNGNVGGVTLTLADEATAGTLLTG